MTVRNLEFLFRPKSVAVVAEPEEQSHYAEIVRGNLETGGFAGPVVAGACILDLSKPLPDGLNDSKKVTPEKRESVAEELKASAVAFSMSASAPACR